MDLHELNRYLSDGEGGSIEFKESKDSMPNDLFETVSSFLNTDGGTILLGADDDGNIQGINENRVNQIKKDIISSLNNSTTIDPPVSLVPRKTEKDGKILLYLKVFSSSQVHKYAGDIYIRLNDADLKIADQERLTALYLRKRNSFTESKIYPAVTLSDLNPDVFRIVRSIIRSDRPDHPWLLEDDMGILRSSNLYRKDFETGEDGLSLAAVLIFGKDETIHNILPAYKLDALVQIENTDRWDDRLVLRTNLIDSYQQLLAFIRKHLPDKFYLEGEKRLDLRNIIFREIIANILIHREYTSALPTTFRITKESVVTLNPNVPRFHGAIFPDSFNPFPKNPIIRKFFNELGWADEIGSGVKNIAKYLPHYTFDSNSPQFLEEDSFRTVLPLLCLQFENHANALIEMFDINTESLSEKWFECLRKMSVSFALELEDDDEFIWTWGPTLLQKGTKLKEARLGSFDEKLEFDGWKGLTLPEKGTKLLGKRGWVIIKILILCIEPLSLDELINIMGYRSKNKFRSAYLKPLVDDDLITRTIPDIPNDPKQQYVLTRKGILFLGGFDI